MSADRFDRIVHFLNRLREMKIPHSLSSDRDNAVRVVAFAPGEYWEIDFLEDGSVDVERFRSSGKIQGEETLEELFSLWSEDEPSASTPVKPHDAVA